MTRALNLYKRYSQTELLSMAVAIKANPANCATNGGLFLYIPAARKKLDDIAQAIAFHLADKREASGHPVLAAGYSGRNSNR